MNLNFEKRKRKHDGDGVQVTANVETQVVSRAISMNVHMRSNEKSPSSHNCVTQNWESFSYKLKIEKKMDLPTTSFARIGILFLE